MKHFRRTISLVLTLCLLGTLLSGICLTASAEEGFTVTFSVPDGVTAPDPMTGTSVVLPAAETPNGNYRFAGWSEVQGTVEESAVLTGTYMPVSDVTLYAVYFQSNGTDGYAKVTETPDSWDGQYLLVCEAASIAFNAGKGTSATALNVANNYLAVTISSGMIAASDALDAAAVTIAQTANGSYTIYLPCNKYLGFTGSSTSGMNVNATTAYEHTINIEHGIATIQNASGTNIRTFVYNTASNSNRFAYYSKASNVSLYKKGDGAQNYTTNVPACEHIYELTASIDATCTADAVNTYTCSVCGLSYSETDANTALGHSFSDEEEPTVVKAPTCTEAGSQKRTCLNCGKQITEAVPATGHSFENNLCTACGEIQPIDPITKTFSLVTSADQLGEGEYILIVKPADPPEPKEGEELVAFNAEYYALKNEVGKPVHNMKAYNADALIGESIPATLTVNEEAIQWYGAVEDGALSLRGYNGWDLLADENNLDFTLPIAGSAPTAWTPTFDEADGTFLLTYLDSGENTRILGIRSDLKPDGEGDPHIKCNNITSLGKSINSSYRFFLYYKAEDCVHSSVTKVTAATCTTTGFNTNYCVLCGRTNISDFTEALGHTPNEDGTTVVDPTCTENGSNTYVCGNCGKTQTEEIPATGHTYENGVCTVCGTEEPVMRDFTRVTSLNDLTDGNYVLVVKGNYKPGWYALKQKIYNKSYVEALNVDALFDGEEVPDAISLSDEAVIWTLTVTDGTFTLTGTDGNTLTTEKSNYLTYDEASASAWTATANDNGTFKLTTTDTEQKARALGLRDDLATTMANGTPLFRCNDPKNAKTSSYEFYLYSDSVNTELKIKSASLRLDEDIDVIYKATVPAGYTDAVMTFTMNGEKVTVPDDGTHTFIFEGVNPQCIGDNISATLTATCDDEQLSDELLEYSVRQYCINQLAKDSISAELRTLLSDVLAYGAAAQTYMSYKTTALVNSGDDIINPAYSTYSGLADLSASISGEAEEDLFWTGAYLTLTSSVAMSFRFYAESIDDLTVTAAVNGREETFTEFTELGDHLYEVSFAGIKANEFADSVTASFSNGGSGVSYSVDTYICSKQNDGNTALAELVKALYNYGAAASAFVN